MKSKTSNIAMFAIAAFAIGGMMVTPAFAADTVSQITQSSNTEGQVTTSSWDTDDCDTSGTECDSRQKIYNEWPGVSDKVSVTVDVQGVSCNMDFTWYKNSVEFASWSYPGTYSGYGFGVAKHTEILETDSIKTTVEFSNCS